MVVGLLFIPTQYAFPLSMSMLCLSATRIVIGKAEVRVLFNKKYKTLQELMITTVAFETFVGSRVSVLRSLQCNTNDDIFSKKKRLRF
jgi:hypothetical protein